MTEITKPNYNLSDLLLDNIDDLIYILNDNLECEYINESKHHGELGYSILSKKFLDVLYYSDLKLGTSFLQDIQKVGKATEQLRIKKNEGYNYYEINGKSFKDNLGNLKLILFAKNISIYKELEKNWEDREKSLKDLAESLPEIRFWKLLQTKSEKTSFLKSREMLELVIDNLPHYIYWKDKDLKYLGCNLSYAMVNSFKDPNYIVGKTDEEIPWARHNLDKIKKSEFNVMSNNLSQENIELWELPNGNEAWFEINRIPLHRLGGDVVGILSTYHNITDRITAEQKVKDSREKYKSILESIKEGYFEVDLKGNFVFSNNSLSNIMGYSNQELMGMNYKSYTTELNKKKIFDVYNRVYTTGKGEKYFQFEFYHKDGHEIIAETSVYLKLNREGKKIGFYGIVQDISDRFLLQQELKVSEEKYRHLFDSSPFAIWLLDLEGKLIDCNKTMDGFLERYKKEDIIGKNYIDVLSMFEQPDNFVPFFKEKFEYFINNTKLTPIEFKIRRNNGDTLWVTVESSKIKLENEIIIQVIIQDVTDKKEARLKLQKSEEDLRILNKELENIILDRTKELRESEAKFRNIAELSTLGITIIQDDRICYANNAMSTINEYSIEEMLAWTPAELLQGIHPEDRNYAIEHLKRRESGDPGLPIFSFYRIITKNKKIKWINSYSRTITYQGKFADLALIADVTENQLAQKKLEESEEKFRNIAEQTSLGIAILQKGCVVYTNQALSEITGYTEEVIGKWTQNEFVKNIHPDDLPFVMEQMQRKLQGDTKLKSHYSCRIFTESKSMKWIDLHSKAINYRGEIADFITFIDITDKMEAEKKLKESEKKYRHLYEKSPYGIALIDLEGKILDINSTISILFGYDREDLIGQNYLKLVGLYPKDTKSAVRTMDVIVSNLNSNGIVKPNITQIYKKDGSTAWLESEISIVNIDGEKIIQAIIQDDTAKILTERKLQESEKKLREQNIELRELDRLKTDFISIAAHELKTPLISIGGYIDLILLREKDLKDEVTEDLNRVINNVHRLENYINRLLDVMKIDAKKMELVKMAENLYEIINSCINELDFQINKKNLNIRLEIDKELVLPVDSFRISQVFSNILSNAVKFTPEGGEIELSTKLKENQCLFKVKDNGKGLTKEGIEKLFGKFVTIGRDVEKFSSFDKGSGLGLYIAKGIIEAHGGRIWVQSEGLDRGSEFYFELPLE